MPPIQESIKLIAARWYIRLKELPKDAPENQEFNTWLSTSTSHSEAFRLVAETMGDFDASDKLAELSKAVLQKNQFEKAQKRKKFEKYGSTLAVLFICAGTGWIMQQQYQTWQAAPIMQSTENTQTAQIITRTLEDGSTITADANSELQITYYRKSRNIILNKGGAIFQVTKDAERPFIVQTNNAKVTVLGTRFAVNQLSNLMRVSVDYGRVQVENTQDKNAKIIILQTGQVAEIAANSAPQLVRKNAADAFGFKDGIVNFDQANMQEVAETLSRYRQPQVIAQFNDAKTPHVSAVFKIKDANQFIQTLPQNFSISLTHTPESTIIRPR